MENSSKTVVVGMSGGVDSSVAALLLKEQGYNVIGLFMKNWEDNDADGICPAAIDYEDVVKVCAQIGIPHYPVNFVKEYRTQVFQNFLDELNKGNTPNPDILCNREIKFKVFLQKALELGADFLATGHYARLHNGLLLKGKDLTKDQSYFLHAVDGRAFAKVLFPIGDLTKKEIRAIAQRHGLATAEKKDSTGICFIGKRNFKEFLSNYLGYQPGNFENLKGDVIGRHEGVAYYTSGQRKGMGIGGPGDAWFVVGKDPSRNVVYIEQGSMHPALYCDNLTATNLTWINTAPTIPFSCKSKVRYRQPDQDCTIDKIENGRAYVSFKTPQRAVTPSQSIVFYDGDICLGGGTIESPGPSYYTQNKPLPPLVST